MFNFTLIIFFLCALQNAAFEIIEKDENGTHAGVVVLPYSLKAVSEQDNSGRYTLVGVKTQKNNQADEEQLADSSHINVLQNRRVDDPWDRISVHYKNQLAQTIAPKDEFGYYKPHNTVATQYLTDGNHFGVGMLTAPLPLALMIIVNIGVIVYLVIGMLTTLSAAGSGLNHRLPYHMYYLREDEHNSKYN